MIPIVEDYLSELLEDKFNYLKAHPEHLSKVLGTSQSKLDRLEKYLKSTPVKIIRGYPRTPAELPSISIMLSGENETQEGLGNHSSDEDSDIREYTEEVVVTSIENGKLAVPYAELSHKPVTFVSQVVSNELGMRLEENEYAISSPTTGLLALYTGMVEDGDTLTVTYSYRATSTELNQVLYEANYRLEVWSLNADLTIELYHLVKWAILSGRDYLGKDKDLFSQRLGGSDFEPATSYFPEFVYRRALTFWCQFTVSTPIEEVPYIDGVFINESIMLDGSE